MNLWNLISEFGNQKLWLGVVLAAWLLFEDKISGHDFSAIASVSILMMGAVDTVRAWTGNTLEGWRKDNDVGVLPPPESRK